MHRRRSDDSKIVLGILEAIESGEQVTQRAVASELGIALGLVNAYLKHCMKKGLVKMRTAPARRYAYYLTPAGFSEKSKLTASFLANSFSFFRRARADCDAVLADAVARRFQRLALFGASDLAEIVRLCAAEQPIQLVAVVDSDLKSDRYAGLPVVAAIADLPEVDGLILTDLSAPHVAYEKASAAVGANRVLIPALLNARRFRPTTVESKLRKVAR